MARIRTVKPEYWTDERVGECSVSARLLFIATWNFADDHGGLDRSAKQLKAQAFPYDNIDCEPLVQELLSAGLLIEYESGGKKYLHIKGFRTHQKVEKPARPRVPLYVPEVNPPRGLTDSSPTPHRGVTVSSSEGNGKEGKGRERETRAREGGGVIDYGTALTQNPADHALECWRRDVPGCNQDAFARWIVHRESRGKPMAADQRLFQARQLATNGDSTAQAEVVDWCIGQGWNMLAPIADVRARRDGMSRAKPEKERWRPPPDEPKSGVG